MSSEFSRRRFLQNTTLGAAVGLFVPPATAEPDPEELELGFTNPPDSARPWVLWFWLSGNITRDGITRDLESFHRAGIRGVWLMNGSLVPVFLDPPVTFRSPEWRAMFRHTLEECERLGMKFSVANCDGWSHSGGHWIKPEQATQRVVHSEVRLKGPTRFEDRLPTPRHKEFYEDIAVLALRTPPADSWTMAELAPKLTTNGKADGDLPRLLDGDPDSGVKLESAVPGQPLWLQIDFDRPVRAGAVRCAAAKPAIDGGYYVTITSDITLQASSGADQFRDVVAVPPVVRNFLEADVWGWKTASFAPVEARSWRLLFRGPVDLREVELIAGSRVQRWEDKSGQMPDFIVPADATPSVSAGAVVDPGGAIDLTGQVGTDGRLRWDVPEGHWTILRLGRTWTGGFVQPASAGSAPEVDKMDRAAVEHHFRAFLGELLKDIGGHAGRTLVGVEMDSWECGSSNWTPRMLEEFRRRRGYDAWPWLPVLAGRVVGDAERSDRFLFDYRRTISELIADGIYSHYRSLLAPHGIGLWAEALGPTIQRGRIQFEQVADALQCKDRVDVPMGEFWVDPPRHGEPALDTKEAAAAAHIYGQRIAAAEAFTAFPHVGWNDYPAMMKSLGDLHYCLGVNLFLLSESVHQPWPDRYPGVTLGPWGTHFQWTTTWYRYCAPWFTYMARCQYLLQQGQYVADLCYYLGEDTPIRLWEGSLKPKPPAGYDYDACTAEALLQRMEVKDGRVVVPGGMSYRLLVLSDSRRMTPEVARKLKQLVAGGAKVLGDKPANSPSLADYPRCDGEVRRISGELWDGGRVIAGRSPEEVLRADGILPDFEPLGAAKLAYIHRVAGGAHIYFVSNQDTGAVAAECAFRVSGKQPEIWDPMTGERRDAPDYRQAGGRTVVPLEFAAAQSYFVVFRAAPKPAAPGRGNFPKYDALMELRGPWTVRFDPKWGGPGGVTFDELQDWTTRREEGVKYYSGTATYEKAFDLPEAGRRLLLDLGEVNHIAEVRLNGKAAGVAWAAPWRVDITEAAKTGRNVLEIDVANLWVNRLVRDSGLPENQRLTWTTHNPYKPDSPLVRSGLIGPVRVIAAEPGGSAEGKRQESKIKRQK